MKPVWKWEFSVSYDGYVENGDEKIMKVSILVQNETKHEIIIDANTGKISVGDVFYTDFNDHNTIKKVINELIENIQDQATS